MVVWAVCQNSVDTDPAEQQVALAVSVAAAAQAVVVACASVKIPSESESEARISVTLGKPRRFACRCAVVDCADAFAGTLFVPS